MPRRHRNGRRKLFVFVASLALAACGEERETRVVHRFLDVSEVDAEGTGSFRGVVSSAGGMFEVRDVAVHGDRRPAIVVAAPSSLSMRAEGASTELRFGLAVRPPESELALRVLVDGELAHEETWVEERDWVEREIDLGPATEGAKRIDVELEGEAERVMLGHLQTGAPAFAGEPRRPNVILYVVDCLRADHVGAYGYERPTTPELDAVAEDAVLLADLNACAPWTKPSTGCLFTSLLPTYHKARTVDDALPRESTTLAELLQAEGYRTLAWVANPVIDPRLFLFNQGFERWVDLRSFVERSGGSHINALDPDAAQITEAVLPWLAAHRDERFFLYLHSLDLHYEYRPRPPFDEKLVSPDSTGLERDRELYDSELAYNDHEIGKLVAALKELSLYEDTVLLVTSDHGEEFGEHGSTRHGKTLHQELLHIPGILKLPGSRFAGRSVEAVASNVDLAPTLLELAGAEIPETMQGRSLLPFVERGAKSTERRVFAEVVAPQVVAYAVRDDRFKYVKHLVPEVEEQLFDLSEDPSENANLIGDVPDRAAALVPELDRFLVLGQHGYHLSVLELRKETRVRVELTTEGRLGGAFRFGIETGDVLERSEDGKRVSLEFTADATRRHVVLQTEPAGAPVSVEMYRNGSRAAVSEIRLGAKARPAAAMPIESGAADVSLQDVERILREPTPGVHLWHVPLDAGGARVTLDEETLRTLRALGYVQ